MKDTDEKVMTGLKQVEYSSRFAVAYFFDKSKVSWPFSWTVKYFDKGHWVVSATCLARQAIFQPCSIMQMSKSERTDFTQFVQVFCSVTQVMCDTLHMIQPDAVVLQMSL